MSERDQMTIDMVKNLAINGKRAKSLDGAGSFYRD